MSGATDTSVQMDHRRMARRALGAVHQPRGGHGAGCGYFCLFDVSGKDLHIGQRQTSRDEPLVHGLKVTRGHDRPSLARQGGQERGSPLNRCNAVLLLRQKTIQDSPFGARVQVGGHVPDGVFRTTPERELPDHAGIEAPHHRPAVPYPADERRWSPAELHPHRRARLQSSSTHALRDGSEQLCPIRLLAGQEGYRASLEPLRMSPATAGSAVASARNAAKSLVTSGFCA